MDVKTVWHVTN